MTAAGRTRRAGEDAGRFRALAPGPALVGLALGAWIAASTFTPFTPEYLQAGLDGSWGDAVAEAADRGLRWGADVLFSYGPASTLVTGNYNADYLPVTVPLLLATCALFGLAAALAVRPRNLAPAAAAMAAAAACAAGMPEGVFFALPLAPLLLLLSRERPGPGRVAIAAAAAAAAGAVGMAKISFVLVALAVFPLGDAAAAARRRPPVLTLPAVVGFVAADALYRQRLGDLPASLRGQLDVVLGFGGAMGVFGSRAELLAFPLCSAALVALVAAEEWRAPRGAGSRLAVPTALAAALFLLFKAGFVRQDGHTLIAWHGLALAAALVAGARLRTRRAVPVLIAAAAGAALLGLRLVGPMAGGADRWGEAGASARSLFLDRPAAQLAAAVEFARDPGEFAGALRAASAEGRQRAAAAAPLPRLEGGVDVIPSEQNRLIASGLDYRPRPGLQEYAAYTPALIAADRAFLQGPRAPAWVLFGPEPGSNTMTIDGRYPDSAEGGLWLDLLRLYRPERRIGPLVALHRRAEPAPVALGAPARSEVGFGDPVPVPPVGDGVRAVFAMVDVRPTVLGRLVSLLYQPPPLTLTVGFADGHEASYRFVPGVAASGFILSPLVEDADSFEALAAGTPPPPGRSVARFSLRAPAWGHPLLAPRIAVTLRPVTVDASAPPPQGDRAQPWPPGP